MDYTSARKPITIDRESESSWYTQTITRKALSSIPDQFKKMPKFETLKFSHRKGFGPTVLANLTQEASPMVLTVGIFDSDLPYMRQAVYALVHGSKSNLVGLFLIKQDLSVYWVAHSRLHKVEFEEPFYTVVSAPEDIASKKRKSDEGSESAPLKIKRRDYSHTIRQRPIIISRLSSPENPVMAKRTEAQPGTSKAENDLLKAAIATHTRPLEVNQARVQTNHQLQEQITSLKAEVSRIKDEYSYGQNAYRGIQARYDELKTQHANALDDGESLREQLRQSQLRCEQAEKRTNVLEAEVERLKRKMREARKALDDPSP
ncbi:unnamed protein product [Alternaria alternata]